MGKKTLIGAALMIGLGIWILKENKHLKVTHHEIRNEKIPSSISGYTIVHVSDYHNTLFGGNNKVLVRRFNGGIQSCLFFDFFYKRIYIRIFT